MADGAQESWLQSTFGLDLGKYVTNDVHAAPGGPKDGMTDEQRKASAEHDKPLEDDPVGNAIIGLVGGIGSGIVAGATAGKIALEAAGHVVVDVVKHGAEYLWEKATEESEEPAGEGGAEGAPDAGAPRGELPQGGVPEDDGGAPEKSE